MMSTITRVDVQREVKAHFQGSTRTGSGAYEKEMSETLAVFRKMSLLQNYTDKACDDAAASIAAPDAVRVLSLAAGSAVGAEVFSDYLSHADSKFYAMDITCTQTMEFLQLHGYVHGFVEEDLYAEPASAAAIHLFSTCTHWMAIHACRNLAARIVHLFKKYAPPVAHLILVPCCLVKSAELQSRIGNTRWKAIREARQARDAATGRPTQGNWRLKLQVQARNELLAGEYSEAFCGAKAIPEIESLHNVALHYCKDTYTNIDIDTDTAALVLASLVPPDDSSPLTTAKDIGRTAAGDLAAERIWPVFDLISCQECA